jgi:IS1 family transposase
MSTDFISKADNKFLVWLKVLIAYLTEKQRRWNIPEDEVNNLQTKAETFTVEGYNSLFRHILARMRRKSKC